MNLPPSLPRSASAAAFTRWPPHESAFTPPPHAGLYMNLPPSLPRFASVVAFTCWPPYESAFTVASIDLCRRLHTNRPFSPPPHAGLPTPTWSFHSQFLTMTFLDNPLSFLYFGFFFFLILNQCYFLCIYDCDVELFFFFLWLWICDVDWNRKSTETNWNRNTTETDRFLIILVGFGWEFHKSKISVSIG